MKHHRSYAHHVHPSQYQYATVVMKVSFFLLLSLGVGGGWATAAVSCGSVPCANEEDYAEYVDNHGAFSRRHKKEEDGVTFDRRDFAYCNSPNNVTFPGLDAEVASRYPGLRLLQVQAIARHGSRVPYIKYMNCWDDYGFEWDCNVTEMTRASSSAGAHDARSPPFIFRKLYDGSPTVLGGTCHLGQLVVEGFEQEAANGRALGAAYIGHGPLKLFARDQLGAMKALALYLRSDDDPSFRTEMSGEALVQSMFEARREDVTLRWHTGDFALDEIAPNHNVCPALSGVEREAMASAEWAAYNQSAAVRELDARMERELPGYQWEHMLDCLGTTVCTGRAFPPSLTHRTLADAFVHAARTRSFKFAWNDAYYSKLGIGPLARELLENMQARAGGRSHLKFGLFLGHDTSVLPLLAAWGVWDGAWPPYAAVLAVELYAADGTGHGGVEGEGKHFFRMLYGGRELILEECVGQSLCPLSVLEAATEPWAMATDDPERPCGGGEQKGRRRKRKGKKEGKGLKGSQKGGEGSSSSSALASFRESSTGSDRPVESAGARAEEGGRMGGTGKERKEALLQEGPGGEKGRDSGTAGARQGMLAAVLCSLLTGMVLGVVGAVSWAERRRRGPGEDSAVHNVEEGIGVLDRFRSRLMGYHPV